MQQNQPAAAPLEGRIVTHAGVTMGSLPKHADDGDARSAIEALSDLKLAELTDHFDPEEDTHVRGAMVEPRGNGRVAVYWLEGGSHRARDGEPFKAELAILADKLRAAGWSVEPKSLFCVFAWRPVAEVHAEVTAQPAAEVAVRLPEIKAGDLVEAETASSLPSTIRVRVDRTPWLIGERRNTVLSDGKGVVAVKTDTVHVVDETRQDAYAAVAPTRRRLTDSVLYAFECRQGDDDWRHLLDAPEINSEDEAQEAIEDLAAITEDGWEYRVVEVRRTLTALGHRTAPPVTDVKRGLVAARKLRSGDRVFYRHAVRTLWKVEFRPIGGWLVIHTVPPVGEDPLYFTYTLSPSQTVGLLSRGPAVGPDGQPLGHQPDNYPAAAEAVPQVRAEDDEPVSYMFLVDGEMTTGTLKDYAKHWEGAYYSSGDVSPIVKDWTGAAFPVRIEHLETDTDLWMRYRLSVRGETQFVTIDGRA